MNVACMVPSWTETLIHAGVNVVGSTRYCIHPREKVSSIPVVGGTKDISCPKVAELKADLLVLDKEENTRFMAEQSPVPWIATDVTSVWDVEKNLQVIHERLLRPELVAIGKRWRDVCERLTRESRNPGWLELPGVIEWVRQPRVDVRIAVAEAHAGSVAASTSEMGGLKITMHLPLSGMVVEPPTEAQKRVRMSTGFYT